jgi:hypothetical protein
VKNAASKIRYYLLLLLTLFLKHPQNGKELIECFYTIHGNLNTNKTLNRLDVFICISDCTYAAAKINHITDEHYTFCTMTIH